VVATAAWRAENDRWRCQPAFLRRPAIPRPDLRIQAICRADFAGSSSNPPALTHRCSSSLRIPLAGKTRATSTRTSRSTRKSVGYSAESSQGSHPSLNAAPTLPRTRHTCRHNERDAPQIIGIDFTPWWCLTGDSGSDRQRVRQKRTRSRTHPALALTTGLLLSGVGSRLTMPRATSSMVAATPQV